MPYRDFTLPTGEVVRTRVSDEATLEWFEERATLKDKGYPDRPPDVDSETNRAWCGMGGKASPYKGVSAWPCASYVLNLGYQFPVLKFILSLLHPGDGIIARFKMESGLDETMGKSIGDFDRMFSWAQLPVLEALIEDTLKLMFELEALAHMLGQEPQWIVTTPAESNAVLDEMDEAIADYEAEFGKDPDPEEPVYPPPPGTGH